MLVNTTAKSVEYELIKAAITVFKTDEAYVKAANDKLHGFLRSSDPNCKFGFNF